MKTLLFFFLGASIGSFLGLVIDRFPHQSILFPASHCNHCKKQLKAWDLIPIVSQISCGSRCRYCKARIPLWYAGFEILAGSLFLLVATDNISFSLYLVLVCGLTLAVYDIKHREYPVFVWLAFAILLLLLNGFSASFFFFLLLALLAELLPLKIGSGDFLYLALAALTLNVTGLLWMIQISSYLGILFLLFSKNRSAQLPFIPFLCLGILCYIHFFSFSI